MTKKHTYKYNMKEFTFHFFFIIKKGRKNHNTYISLSSYIFLPSTNIKRQKNIYFAKNKIYNICNMKSKIAA